MKQIEKNIVTNIIKIRNDKEIKQATVAAEIEIDSSTYSKIESGQIGLSIERLAKIATYFNMSIIDVITYPKKYIDIETLSDEERKKNRPKVILQLELEEEKKEQVLKVVFGENNLEILNK
jgi:transcriptional regulator with XRE-family HTH domain